MTDHTYEIARLQRAKIDLSVAKQTARVEVREKYAEKIRQEIEDRTLAAEVAFAKDLKAAHERGVPASVIRKEVLRTGTWSTWVYWRDLAEIEPDRVRTSVATPEQTYRFEDGTLHLMAPLEIALTDFTIEPDDDEYTAYPDNPGEERARIEEAFGSLAAFNAHVKPIVKSLHEKGEL